LASVDELQVIFHKEPSPSPKKLTYELMSGELGTVGKALLRTRTAMEMSQDRDQDLIDLIRAELQSGRESNDS
jgi:hypothetical protein